MDSSSFDFFSLRSPPPPSVSMEEASPDPATALDHMAACLINLILAVFSADMKVSSLDFQSPGGPLEEMLSAVDVLARACRQPQAMIKTSPHLLLVKRLVSLNKLCISTLKWSRERVKFMTEICSSKPPATAISSESNIVGNMLVRDIVELVETVLRDPADFQAMMLAIGRAGKTSRYGPATIRPSELSAGELQDAMRLCGWSRLCVVTVRWALDWAPCMMDASNVSESIDRSIVGSLNQSEDDDAGSLIAYASDSTNSAMDSTRAAGDESGSSDIDDLDASYVFV